VTICPYFLFYREISENMKVRTILYSSLEFL
jgi:hypothetical protein